MRYALMLEPQQGMSYADQLASAKRAEANGFDAFFRSDHYASFPGEGGQPTTDAWTVLAGLARETERITLGVLVSPVTFRHPGALAKVITTVDEMSGGRIEVGCRRGLERPRASPAGARLPTDRAARRPARGPAGDPAGPVGRARRLVVRRADRHQGARRVVPAATGRRGRPSDDTGRRQATAHHRRQLGVCAVLPARRQVRRRVQPQLVVARSRGGGAREARRRVPGGRPRSVHAGTIDDGRHPRGPLAGRGARARTADARDVRGGCRDRRGLARGAPTALGLRDAGRRPRPGGAIRTRPASSGSCSRTSSRGTWTWSTSWARSSSAGSEVSRRLRRPRGSGPRRDGSGPGRPHEHAPVARSGAGAGSRSRAARRPAPAAPVPRVTRPARPA